MKAAGESDAAIEDFFRTQRINMRVFSWNHTTDNIPHTMDTTMTPIDSIKYMQQVIQGGF
jgi:penicillin-binding protein 1A